MIKETIKKIIPKSFLGFYHLTLSFLGAVLYGFPSKKLTVMGITGTNGKTTTVDLTRRVLEKAGYKVASLSSISFKIGDKKEENMLKMTMPGRFKLQKLLKKAVKAKCKYAVLEVSSEGIKQHRHRFVDFDVVSLTNLSSEHIESHGGFENYKKCKGKLFQLVKKGTHVLNLDDENVEYFLKFSSSKKILFTAKEKDLDFEGVIKAKNIKASSSSLEFSVENFEFELPLLGKFNVYNALNAICMGLSQGVSFEKSKEALREAKGVPGRMEIVIEKPFTVVVDYAVTPVSLEEVYKTLSGLKEKDSSLISVLGSCGGGRDKWKRPIFGEIASRYCKEVIVTNEDPYEEDPMEIINQVGEGAGKKAKKILDRREAIRESLCDAKKGDIIIITGKGCEPWMCVAGGKKIPWDDRKIVREEFKKLNL